MGDPQPPPGDPEKAKPLSPDCLAAEGLGVSEQAALGDRLRRYGTAKNRNHQMAGHCVQVGLRPLADRLYACGNYLRFRHYLEHRRTCLVESRSCDVHLLCPLCAIRRGGRLLRRYVERIEVLAPDHDFEFVTLTVKNGPDLSERMTHLRTSLKKLRERARKGYGAFAQADGALWSIEFTKSPEGWHPHIHMIWARPKGAPRTSWGKDSQLGLDWFSITGDSYIVHAEPIGTSNEDRVAVLCEALKYALKFSDLALADNLAAYRLLKGKRLMASSGVFYGLEIPEGESLDDDELDGPFIEMLFLYAGSRGYVPTRVPDRPTFDVPSLPMGASHAYQDRA